MVRQARGVLGALTRRKDPGQVLVMVSVMMMVLLGFVALASDTGLIWVNRRGLQNAADAAALAGAQDLNPSDPDMDPIARSVACDYATTKNGIGDMEIDCTGNGAARSDPCEAQPNVDINICQTYTPGDTIRVTTHKTINPIFGVAVGFGSVDIAAQAKVVIGSVRAACTVPLFQTQDTLEASGVWNSDGSVNLYTQTVMKTSDSASGNFLALQVEGSSSKDDWREAMSDPTRCFGEDAPMTEGETTTNPGNFDGPFDQAMWERQQAWLAQGTCGAEKDATTFLAADGKLRYADGTELTPANCYRMVQIPMLEGTLADYNGSKVAKIKGFLTFYISNWCGASSDPAVKSGFCDPPPGITEPLAKAELWGYYVGWTEGGVDAQPYDGLGSRVAILVE